MVSGNIFCVKNKGIRRSIRSAKVVLKSTGGSTVGLHEHVKKIHNINALKMKVDDDVQPQPTSSSDVHRPVAAATGTMIKYLLNNNEQTLPQC